MEENGMAFQRWTSCEPVAKRRANAERDISQRWQDRHRRSTIPSIAQAGEAGICRKGHSAEGNSAEDISCRKTHHQDGYSSSLETKPWQDKGIPELVPDDIEDEIGRDRDEQALDEDPRFGHAAMRYRSILSA